MRRDRRAQSRDPAAEVVVDPDEVRPARKPGVALGGLDHAVGVGVAISLDHPVEEEPVEDVVRVARTGAVARRVRVLRSERDHLLDDPDASAGVVPLHRPVRGGVRLLQMEKYLDRGRVVEGPGREVSLQHARHVDVAAHRQHHRLVQRDPVVHEPAELPRHVAGVLAELGHGGAVEPAAGPEPPRGRIVWTDARERVARGEWVVRPARQREVAEGDPRGEPTCVHQLEDRPVARQRVVVREAIERAQAVCVAGRAGKDPAPFDAESECAQVELPRGEIDVGPVAREEPRAVLRAIGGDGPVRDVPRVVRPGPPIRAGVEIAPAAHLDLEPGRGDAPLEPAREVAGRRGRRDRHRREGQQRCQPASHAEEPTGCVADAPSSPAFAGPAREESTPAASVW